MRNIKTIGIYCKLEPASNARAVSKITHWLQEKQVSILMDSQTAEFLNTVSSHSKTDILSKVDLIVVLGGDGTLLSVARLAHSYNVPILAVNLGSLGFITEIALSDFEEAFEKLIAGKLTTENRMLLNAGLWRKGRQLQNHHALNEIVVDKGSHAKIIDLEVCVDGGYMTSYRADGLIIATPTGSTAYSLSAGGPIIHPRMHALVLSPISPFTLTNRPIVVPDQSEIKVKLGPKTPEARVNLDGQEGYEMTQEDLLIIKKGDHHIALYQSPNKTFYQILREKLQWGAK